jgi:hypothetical protein
LLGRGTTEQEVIEAIQSHPGNQQSVDGLNATKISPSMQNGMESIMPQNKFVRSLSMTQAKSSR